VDVLPEHGGKDEERRQKRGSVIIEVPTESEHKKLVREGIIIDSEWYRVTVWDVAMRETQCFRCWKWGHSQSVCNASEELCGYCAGKHATKECITTDKEHASCAACKSKGHHAF
jgi:hypothetical protein